MEDKAVTAGVAPGDLAAGAVGGAGAVAPAARRPPGRPLAAAAPRAGQASPPRGAVMTRGKAGGGGNTAADTAAAAVLEANAIARKHHAATALAKHPTTLRQESAHAALRGLASDPSSFLASTGSTVRMDSRAALEVHAFLTGKMERRRRGWVSIYDALGSPVVAVPKRVTKALKGIAKLIHDFSWISTVPEIQNVGMWHSGLAICALDGGRSALDKFSLEKHELSQKHKLACTSDKLQSRLDVRPTTVLRVDASRTVGAQAIYATVRDTIAGVLLGYGMSASAMELVFSNDLVRALSMLPPKMFSETTVRMHAEARLELVRDEMRAEVGRLNDALLQVDKGTSETGAHSGFLCVVVSHVDLSADIRLVLPLTAYPAVLTPNDATCHARLVATAHAPLRLCDGEFWPLVEPHVRLLELARTAAACPSRRVPGTGRARGPSSSHSNVFDLVHRADHHDFCPAPNVDFDRLVLVALTPRSTSRCAPQKVLRDLLQQKCNFREGGLCNFRGPWATPELGILHAEKYPSTRAPSCEL
jgi:hypothetical protein